LFSSLSFHAKPHFKTSNFKKEFKQIVPFLFVNISTHPRHPKNFLNSLNRRKNDENLIRNGEKTLQETTFLQPNNDNVMISIETDMNNVDTAAAINHKKGEIGETNGNITQNGGSQKRTADNSLVVINGCDEIMTTAAGATSGSDMTSSRTLDTSIS
jgi:hypothetical protein